MISIEYSNFAALSKIETYCMTIFIVTIFLSCFRNGILCNNCFYSVYSKTGMVLKVKNAFLLSNSRSMNYPDGCRITIHDLNIYELKMLQ